MDLTLASRELHHRAIVIDGHGDTLLNTLVGKRDLSQSTQQGHLDLPRLREGCVTCQFLPCSCNRMNWRC